LPDRNRAGAAGLLTASALLCALALVLGQAAQHLLDMQPCAWCVLQRLLFLLVGAFALIGWLARGSRAMAVAMSALAFASAAGGTWAALHQQFVASQSESCVFTFADRTMMKLRLDESLPWLFEATASCSEANLPLLGLPFATWSAALFVLLALLAIRAALLSRNLR